MIASLLALCVVCLLLLESGSVGRLAESPISNPGRVLLVTAHPDDEVIFFSSTITALHASDVEVFLLCLTNGASIVPRTESVHIPKDFCVRKPMSRLGKVWTVGPGQALLHAPMTDLRIGVERSSLHKCQSMRAICEIVIPPL